MIQKNTNYDFKYYAKLQEGKKTRYFYTKAEYDAYTKPENVLTENIQRESYPKRLTTNQEKKSTNLFEDIKRQAARAYRAIVPKPLRRVADALVTIGKYFLRNQFDIDIDSIGESKKGKEFVNKYKHTDLDSFLKNNQKGYDALSKNKDTDSKLITIAIDRISTNPKQFKVEHFTSSSSKPLFKEIFHDPLTNVYIAFDENDKINVSIKNDSETPSNTPFMSLKDDGTLNLEKDWFEKADTSEKNQLTVDERRDEVNWYRKNEPDFLKNIPRVEKTETYDEIMDNINERYLTKDTYRNNCEFSTLAYEVRCRGYDIDVLPMDAIEATQSISGLDNKFSIEYNRNKHEYEMTRTDVPTMYENPETIVVYNHMLGGIKHPVDTIEKLYPKGTRGALSFAWSGAKSAHTVVFEIDYNGEMIVRDTQNHKVYTGAELDRLFDYVEPLTIHTTRTDNLELKKGVLYALRSN